MLQTSVDLYFLHTQVDLLNFQVIKIVAKSIEQYDNFNQVLIKEINFRSLNSNIVLKEIKNTNVEDESCLLVDRTLFFFNHQQIDTDCLLDEIVKLTKHKEF